MSTDIILYLVEGQKEVSVTNQLIQTFNDNKYQLKSKHVFITKTL